MKWIDCGVVLSLPLVLAVACASSAREARWAHDLESELACGLSEEQVEELAGAELERLEARGRFGSHVLRRGGTNVWLEFNEDGLASVLTAKPRALKRMRISLRKDVCTGEELQLARLFFPAAFGGASVSLDGLGIGRLPLEERPFDFEMVVGTHELLVEPQAQPPVRVQLGPEQVNEDGILVVRLESSGKISPW